MVPLTEHEAFDFVAYREGRFLRVQAKYRSAKNGTVSVTMKMCWADRHGVHIVPVDRNAIDLIAVYCPDTEACYYLDPRAVEGQSIYLRVTETTKNNVSKGVWWAKDFTEIPKTVLGLPAGFGVPLERMPFVRHSREPRATWFVSAHSSAG